MMDPASPPPPPTGGVTNRRRLKSIRRVAAIIWVCAIVAAAAAAPTRAQSQSQCPWSTSLADLHSACTCLFPQSKLTVECRGVNVARLLDALRENASSAAPIESLAIVNSTLPLLADNVFYNLRIANIRLANCGIRNVSAHAFRTVQLEDGLLSLAMPDNRLTSRALAPLKRLRSLRSLDLSRNDIRRLDDDAFDGLSSLDTLNLMENNLTDAIAPNAFRGLETSLKNLNLKATGQSRVPVTIRNMTALAFLDLAQNAIDAVGQRFFEKMASLTALSLERNRMSELDADAFRGVEATMTSLSLLNNDFDRMPTAVSILKELRVLDLGFNRIYEIPEAAFQNLTSLTLLALDGNPLVTLSFQALKHLHATLRGLTIGGKSLVCDCNLRWIAEWVQEYDLQVTSRERNPQFCGHPQSLQNKNLYLLRPAQFVCPETTAAPSISQTTTTTTTTTTEPTTTTTDKEPIETSSTKWTTEGGRNFEETSNKTTPRAKSLDEETFDDGAGVVNIDTPAQVDDQSPTTPPIIRTRPDGNENNQRSARRDGSLPSAVTIREAFRDAANVVVTWEVTSADNDVAAAGFKVIYRSFGDDRFKEGAILPARVRKFRMTNVPPSECCLIVCVVGLGQTSNSTLDVPNSNCRELLSASDSALAAAGQSSIDILVIILIVAVGCTLCVAVIIICVCCCCRRRWSKRKQEKSLPLPLPPPPPPIVQLSSDQNYARAAKFVGDDDDQNSAYSSRSIPRARMYHPVGRSGGTVNSAYLQDEARNHFAKQPDDRGSHSMIDGQYGGANSYADSQYPMGRSELNRSCKSLAMSMPVYHVHNQPANNGGGNQSDNQNQKTRRKGKVHQQRNGYAGETGHFNHANPWLTNADVDNYNSNGNHVSHQPFNKRDFT